MNELELRADAMLLEIRQQREFYANRCAVLAAELSIANATIDVLSKQLGKRKTTAEVKP